MRNRLSFRLTITAITAALYVALTLGLPFSYGSIQFRLSEILNLMAFIDPLYGVGVIIGCLISNIFSPLGLIDVVVGTSATAIAIFLITKTKNLFVASLWPMVANILVGFELTYVFEGTPLLFNILTVMLGEFAVVTCIGFPLFKYILLNKKLYAALGLTKK